MAKRLTDKTKRSLAPMDAKTFFAQKSASGDARVEIDDQVLSLTNLSKVLFPKDGYTKFDIMKYYFTMGKYILPYLAERPIIMKRYPNGIDSDFFYQHNLEDAPKFIRTHAIGEKRKIVNYVIVEDIADMIYMVNLGAISQNPFHTRTDDPVHPDYFVFDLDPGDTATYKDVCKLALVVKRILDEVKIACYPKTSGSSGIHLYVPIKREYTYDVVVRFSKAVSRAVAEEHPEVATIERFVKNREKGQIYMDYLQNLSGKTIASVYCVREKDGATISTPLTWAEVKRCVPISKFTIKNVPARVKAKGDLFKKVLAQKQNLSAALKRLEKAYRV